jgi:hypothetical protein
VARKEQTTDARWQFWGVVILSQIINGAGPKLGTGRHRSKLLAYRASVYRSPGTVKNFSP